MTPLSFLQSKEWMDFQRSLGRPVFEYDKDGIGASVVRHDIPFGKNYLYIPHGPEMDFNSMIGGTKNPLHNFKLWLKDVAKRQKSIYIKAEPLLDNIAQSLVEIGFRKSKKELQPSKTVIIDLKKDEYDLLGAMHHKTRYNIKVAEKHGIHIDKGNTEDFWKLMKKTSKRDSFGSHSKDYYKKLTDFFRNKETINVEIFFAKHDKRPVAAAIILTSGDTGFYLHGASDHDYRNLMAPYLLHWQIIKYLKDKGLANYDLWGIDARSWPGVTRFKLGWGGRLVERPGAFDLTISWLWHTAYKIWQKTRRR